MSRNIKFNGSLLATIVFLMMIIIIASFSFNAEEKYHLHAEASDGIISIKDISDNHITPLTGEWFFYENQLITTASEASAAPKAVLVPHYWNGTGYGTYVVSIENLAPKTYYGLYINDVSSAYALYVDGVFTGNNGVVGTSQTSEAIYWNPQMLLLKTDHTSIEIAFQISNYYSYPGGFSKEMYLGTPAAVQNLSKRKISTEMMLFGGLIFMGLYNLVLFLMNRKERSALYFSLFSFSVALRVLVIGQRLINLWFENTNWHILARFQFIISSVMLATFAAFMYSLFKDYFKRWILWVVLGFSALLILVASIFPLTNLQIADYAFLGVAASYFAYILLVLIKAIRQKVVGSLFSFIGVLFITISLGLDLILPPGTLMIPLGLYVFLVFQSLVIAEKYAIISEENKMLQHVAIRDSMTNLYNKEHFQVLVEKSLSMNANERGAMLFIDIDNFKVINDTYGHSVGDEAIIIIAQNILKSLRYSDIACRFGGDEFVLWLKNAHLKDAAIVATRILEISLEPMLIEDQSIETSLSIGISFYPDDGSNLETLFKTCDDRMYQAKRQGKNQYNIGE